MSHCRCCCWGSVSAEMEIREIIEEMESGRKEEEGRTSGWESNKCLIKLKCTFNNSTLNYEQYLYSSKCTLSTSVIPAGSNVLFAPLLQYISVSGAEPWSVPLPGLVKYRRLPARPQQPALPLTALNPAGPWGQWRLPQPQRGQQHRKPAGSHDASRHWQLAGWVELCVGVCVRSLPVCLRCSQVFDTWIVSFSSCHYLTP